MNILYKILFEVKVLHEYYLTDPQGNSIFDLPTQAARLQFLEGRFATDISPVNEDLIFSLTEDQQALFRNYRMVLINSYSGCQVAIAVNASLQSDGTTLYTPVIPVPENLNLTIGISEARSFIDQLTNARMATVVNAARYFSNEQVFTPKVFPSLSTPLQAYTTGYGYEQGELASYGPNDIRAYYYYVDESQQPPVGEDSWAKISGQAFSGEQDRLAVSPRFFYSFSAADGVSNAVFQLKDGTGQIVNARTVSSPSLLGKVLLDYSALLVLAGSGVPGVATLPQAPVGAGLLYTLFVTGDNGYSRQVPLIFYQQGRGAPVNYWGWIQVQTTVSNPAFNLLDANGRLITQTQSNGMVTSHLIFEIWLKSRFTFWRYENDEGGTLTTPGTNIASFLDLVGGELVTKVPRFTIYQPTYFLNTTNNSYYFLPNPDPESVPEIDGRQFFSNILVPDSTLFPIT
jgi:hypothetical protein